jgi:hypothetical protein
MRLRVDARGLERRSTPAHIIAVHNITDPEGTQQTREPSSLENML